MQGRTHSRYLKSLETLKNYWKLDHHDRLERTSSQLQNHVNSSSSGDVVGFQSFVVRKLLSRVNQSNLVNLNTLLLLECLFHSQNLVFRFKVEGLFTSSQSLNENLKHDTTRSNEWRAEGQQNDAIILNDEKVENWDDLQILFLATQWEAW